jgi:hypothetical protein
VSLTQGEQGTRVGRLIQAATLDPTAVPPSAVLLVRRLEDPLPRTLQADHGRATVPVSWETACRDALERESRHAVRPARGPIPASANSVLFSDRSELLACFARDLVTGAGGGWWWQVLFRGSSRAGFDQIVSEWLCEPHHLPGTLAWLVELRAAEPVLRALGTDQADRLFAAMVQHYGLALPAAGFSPISPDVVATAAGGAASEVREQPTTFPEDGAPAPPSAVVHAAGAFQAPWVALLGEEIVPRSLPRAHQQLLGVALVLHRTPLAARQRAFHLQLLRWQRANIGVVPGHSSPSIRPAGPVSQQPASSSVPAELNGQFRGEPPPETQQHETEPPSEVTPQAQLEPSQLTEGPSLEELKIVEGSDGRSMVEDVRTTHPEPAPSTFDGEWISTELGGVFFLVTVLERLQLLELLETHFHIESNLGSWDWLGLLARTLLGKTKNRYQTDPVWHALDLLAGRDPGDAFPYQFTGAAVYQLPPSWHQTPNGLPRFRCTVGRGRQQLWHPALFLLEDRTVDPGSPAPAEPRLPKARRKLARARSDPGLEPGSVPAELHRFLEFILPYLRWRLTRALSLESGEDLVTELLLRRGDLSITRSHVDLRMPLESVRLSVRLAGLDQDPGWVPAFGRVIAFHFTSPT